jgi:hypothetical protein
MATQTTRPRPIISPLAPGDLAELSRFLSTGFKSAPDADFSSLDVLRWKYLELVKSPLEAGSCPAVIHEHQEATTHIAVPKLESRPISPVSFVARTESGQIVGHIGICRTNFEGQALAAYGGLLPTIHIIDWIGSPQHRSVGMSLMRKAHEGTVTQFGMGVSQAALVVGERAGYRLRQHIPVYARVLRAGYWLRAEGMDPLHRSARLVRDLLQRSVNPLSNRSTHLTLRPISAFGPEICPIAERVKASAVFTTRNPARLNHFLRFPRQAVRGYHLIDNVGNLRGWALLNVIPKGTGQMRMGKIIDCLVDQVDISLWQDAFLTLTRELTCQGADIAQAYASTPWCVKALEHCGFRSRFTVMFHIRDRQGLMPADAIFYVTPLEGDYAYT